MIVPTNRYLVVGNVIYNNTNIVCEELEKVIYAPTAKQAVLKLLEDSCYKVAKRPNMQPIYCDTQSGDTRQVGYYVVCKPECPETPKENVYCGAWLNVHELINPFTKQEGN